MLTRTYVIIFVLLIKVSKDTLTNATTRISLAFGFTKLQQFFILADFVLYQPINGHLQLNSLKKCVQIKRYYLHLKYMNDIKQKLV